MNKINILISRWLRFAEEDLIISKEIFKAEHVIYRSVCFHCQQSVEKYLKAYQIKFDIQILKTHDIEALLNSLSIHDDNILKFLEPTEAFVDYAVRFRYPDDFEDITRQQAEKSIEIATEIEKYITEKIVL